jgi:nicotinate dehydrogenase subunit A
MTQTVTIKVNGQVRALELTPQASLLHVLRNDFELNGAKYGCGLGECGACTVLVDHQPARSCVIPALGVGGRSITTLEGLPLLNAQTSLDPLHPVQRAFIDAQGTQCGYCLSGMIMMTVALLLKNAQPSRQEVLDALSGNLCRCGAHVEILKAVELSVQYTRELDGARDAQTAELAKSASVPLEPGTKPGTTHGQTFGQTFGQTLGKAP